MELKEKLKKYQPVLGTWVISPSVNSLEAICSAEIDFVILDQEHGAITNKDLLPLINTSKSVKSLLTSMHFFLKTEDPKPIIGSIIYRIALIISSTLIPSASAL